MWKSKTDTEAELESNKTLQGNDLEWHCERGGSHRENRNRRGTVKSLQSNLGQDVLDTCAVERGTKTEVGMQRCRKAKAEMRTRDCHLDDTKVQHVLQKPFRKPRIISNKIEEQSRDY